MIIASIEILFCFGQWELDFLHHFQLVAFFILERKKLDEHFGSFFIAGIFEILLPISFLLLPISVFLPVALEWFLRQIPEAG